MTGWSLLKTRLGRHCASRIIRCAWRDLDFRRFNPRKASRRAISSARARGPSSRDWRALVSELRQAAERDHRMDVRHHDSRCGLAVPRGGAKAITQALIGYLKSLGGTVHTSHRIDAAQFRELESSSELVFFDTTPRELVAIAGERLAPKYKSELERFQLAPGAFKVDYALSQPVPWRARIAGERSRYTWADRSRRLRHPNSPWPMGAKPNSPLCWWRSPRSLIHRARLRENMCCGLIVTCRMALHST
jgi:hypothetical protein